MPIAIPPTSPTATAAHTSAVGAFGQKIKGSDAIISPMIAPLQTAMGRSYFLSRDSFVDSVIVAMHRLASETRTTHNY